MKTNYIKKINTVILTVFSTFCFNTIVSAQQVADSTVKDRNWRIELEPSGFAFKGYGIQVLRNVTKNNKFNVGLYATALNLPIQAQERMFKNLATDAKAKLGFEIAALARYYFTIGKYESKPYVGVIAGWEYFDINQPALKSVRISTIITSPCIGYEIYFYKRMLYINPQLRSVFYLNSKVTDATNAEQLRPFFLLPTVSIGIKL
jgi:hypothetical protein